MEGKTEEKTIKRKCRGSTLKKERGIIILCIRMGKWEGKGWEGGGG